MAFDNLQTLDIIETMNKFLESIRPPESIRDQLDIGYLIEENSILIVEIRPQWNKPEIIHQTPVAKTTFIKTKNHWKVFWMRSDLKWHSYTPKPIVTNLKSFTKLVQEDKHSCFFG